MSRLMVIGCGGVASVAVHKCCQNSGVFTELMIASRTKSKCDALKAQLEIIFHIHIAAACDYLYILIFRPSEIYCNRRPCNCTHTQ